MTTVDITKLPREDLENLVDEQRALLEGAQEALHSVSAATASPNWDFIHSIRDRIDVELGL